MTIKIHEDVVQGSDDWLAMRCGRLTASELRLIITPTLKIASNDKERAHLYELAAQRISNYVEPHYVNDDMLRGVEEEFYARQAYAEHFAEVETVGFITNDRWGFTLGYSPDGLVGDDGLIEIKSRRAKYQVQTIIEDEVPADYMIQLQAGLLISEREWIDFISYSGGLPMVVKRVFPDDVFQSTIIEAAAAFEQRLSKKLETYRANIAGKIPTERRIEQEMYI